MMTAHDRGFLAAMCSPATARAETLRLDESRYAPCHVPNVGADSELGNVIQLGKRRARRLRSPIRNDARDKGLDLIEECIGKRVTRVELAALFDSDEKAVRKMLEGETPFPAEAFVLVALRRPDLAVEVVVSYVSLLSDACLDTVIDRLIAVREERKPKKPS